jgi:hypothetical protein
LGLNKRRCASATAPPPISNHLKKRWSNFIRKVFETDPLTFPNCQGDLSAVAQAGMRIISFIDQPEVIKKIRQDLGRREEFHASPRGDPPVKEITFDLSYSLGQWLIRLRWKLI